MISTNVIPLVLVILTLIALLLLMTFLIWVLVTVFLKLRDIIMSNTSSQTTDLETKLVMVQVGMAQMNQEVQLIQNVLETMIPTVSRLAIQQVPERFLPTPVTTQQTPKRLVSTSFKGCYKCGDSHYMRNCPYKGQKTQEKP